MTRFGVAAGLALVLGVAGPADAAFLFIDDRDPGFITITANDFDAFGLFVDNQLVQQGLGQPASITLPDGVLYQLDATWLDNGLVPVSTVGVYFSPDGQGNATSGFGYTSRNLALQYGQLSGTFAGYSEGVSYGQGATLVQGAVQGFSLPFLSGSFASEAAVAEPGTMALLGVGAVGVAALRRRRRAG